MTQKVEIVIESKVDTASLNKSEATIKNELQKLDKETKLQLSLNVAKIKDDIRKAKQIIKSQNLQWDARIQVEAKVERLKWDLRKASAELRNFTDRWNKNLSWLQKMFRWIGNQVRQMGVALAWVFAARAFGKFIADWIRDAIAFEKWLARINTVARVTAKELDWLGDSIKQISKDLGISKEELIETWFNISSAWVEFQDVSKILRLSGKVAIGAATDTNTAFEGIISVIKGYWLEMTEANRVADLFFKTNELGQTTVWDVAGSIWQVATIAKNSKIPLEELFGVYSTLTGVTGDANRVTTQLKAAILALSAPTTEASKKFKEMWVDVWASAIEQKWFVQVAKDIYDAVDGDQEQLRKLVPSVEALTLVTALSTDQFDVYNGKLNKLENSFGALDLAVWQMEATTAQKVAKITETRNFFKESVWGAFISVWYALSNFRDKILAFQNGGEQPFKPMSDDLDNLNATINEQAASFQELKKQEKDLLKSYYEWWVGAEEYKKQLAWIKEEKQQLIATNKETIIQKDLEVEKLKLLNEAQITYQAGLDELNAKKEEGSISNKTYEASLQDLQTEFSKAQNIIFDYKTEVEWLNKQRFNTSAARKEFEAEKKKVLENILALKQYLSAKAKVALASWNIASYAKLQRAMYWVNISYLKAAASVWNYSKEEKKIDPTWPKWPKKAKENLDKYAKSAQKSAEKIKELTGEEYKLDEALLNNKNTASDYADEVKNYENSLSDFGKTAELEELNDKSWKTAEDYAKIKDLKSEKSLAFEWLSEEEIQKMKDDIDSITEYESMSKIEQLQKDREALQADYEEQTKLLEWFQAEKKKLLDDYAKYIKKSADDEISLAKQVEAAWKRAAAARVGGWSSSSSTGRATGWDMTAWNTYITWEYWPEVVIPKENSNVIPNKNIVSNVNVNTNNNVASNVDVELMTEKLARKIQLAQQGIYD